MKRKLKYALIIIILLILSSLVTNSSTISRYLSTIIATGIPDIGYTIFKIEDCSNSQTENYDVETNIHTIGPGDTKVVQYKITNEDDEHYNKMNLKYYLKITDKKGNTNLEVNTSIDGYNYVATKGFGPFNHEWQQDANVVNMINVEISCPDSIKEQKMLNYYLVAEAYNEAAEDENSSNDSKVVVRRSIPLNINIFKTYQIEYELYNNGSNVAEQPTEYNLGETVNLHEPTSSTHDFLGWYDNPEFTGQAITTFSNKNENLKFYAKWQEKDAHILKVTSIPSDATIQYTSTGGIAGSATGVLEIKVYKDDKVTVTVSKSNYETIVEEYIIGDTDRDETIEIRRKYNFNLNAKAINPSNEENAEITYTINEPASLSTSAKNQSGQKTGNLSGNYPVGTQINVTIWKSGNYENIQKNYTITSSDIDETVKIRRLYNFSLAAKKITSNVQTDANISYTITQPASVSVSAVNNSGSSSGSLSGTYPIGTKISVTVSENGYESISKEYTISNSDITDSITIRRIFTYTLNFTQNNTTITSDVKVTTSSSGGEIVTGSTGTNEVTKTKTFKVIEGTTINWSANADYYTGQSGSYTGTADKTENITLALKSATTASGISAPSGTSGSGVNDLADANKKTEDFDLFQFAELGKNETIYYTFNKDSAMDNNAIVTKLKVQYIICYGLRNAKVNIGVYLNGTLIASSNSITADYLTTSYNKRKTWSTPDISSYKVKASDIANGNLKFGITCTTRGCNVFGADIQPTYINP